MMIKSYSVLLIILIICVFSCNRDDYNNDVLRPEELEELRNMPFASDVDELGEITTEFNKRIHAKPKDQSNIVIYGSPGRMKIAFDIYDVIDKGLQDDICQIMRDIKKDKRLNKEIVIKFYRKENFVKVSSGYLRKDEELLNTLIIENK